MKFIYPQLFWLVPPIVAAVIVLGVLATRRRREMLKFLLGRGAESSGALRLSMAKRRWRRFFLAAAACFLVAAAARPFWATRQLPGRERGRDVLVIFDVSRSMLAADLPPSRLEHAKFLLRELVRENRGDRFALVAFAGEAFLSCPFTSDAGAFGQYVDELEPDLVPVGGTDLEKALRTALAAFRSAGGHRAIVLFTDGDELSGDSGGVLAALRKQRIPIMVVGLGDPAAATPLPDENGALRRDRNGKVITSRLNEAALKRLAAESGGIYLRAGVADTGLGAVTARLRALERAETERSSGTAPVEKFPIALVCAAVSLAFAMLISEAPYRRRAMLWCCAAAFLLFGAGAADPASSPAVSAAVPATPLAGPAAEEKLPEDPAERYNLALSLQRKGETAKAVPIYEDVLRDDRAKGGVQSRAIFNLGVANHLPAREAFRAAAEELRRQQPDAALRKLAEAETALKKAEELYTQSLTTPEVAAFEESVSADLEELMLDRRAIEALKKKIEELKKQQQKAREQAKQAQQRNRQDQQQQQQQQGKNRQQPQDQQQQGKDRQQPQDQQQQGKDWQQPQDQQQQGKDRQQQQDQPQQGKDRQQQQQRDQRQTEAARKAAEELKRQARDLGQKRLADDAAAAEEELKKAAEEERRGDRDAAGRRIDEAVKRLGEPRNDGGEKKSDSRDGKEKKPEKKEEKQPRPGEDAERKPLPAQPSADGEKEKDRRENAAEMVRILDDETKDLRDKLNRIRRSRRPAVEKDW